MESGITGSAGTGSSDSSSSHLKGDYWKNMVGRYERRNATLECRQARLADRLRALECTLPTVLMNAMVSMHYGNEPPKIDLDSILSVAGVPLRPYSLGGYPKCSDSLQDNGDKVVGKEVQLVYKRRGTCPDCKQETNGGVCFVEQSGDARQSNAPTKTALEENAGYASVDEEITGGCPTCEMVEGPEGPICDLETHDRPGSMESDNASIMSSHDLIALGRIQELAEQERVLKKYVNELEDREKNFHQTLQRANKLLNDPLECIDCSPICPGAEAKEKLSCNDPLILRLQKLEFYNKKMLLGMRNLREEKNFLRKQTELLKSELRNTQEKLGEVQKEVLGDDQVISVMGEPSISDVDDACSCNSTSNNQGGKPPDNRTLTDLAKQFEDVLKKAQNHGLCNLTGPIKETAMKLKQLGRSEENKCICDCPCDTVPKNGASKIRDCNCSEWGSDTLGPGGAWICKECGEECLCDVDSTEMMSKKGDAVCKCGCDADTIPCECGCHPTETPSKDGDSEKKNPKCICSCEDPEYKIGDNVFGDAKTTTKPGRPDPSARDPSYDCSCYGEENGNATAPKSSEKSYSSSKGEDQSNCICEGQENKSSIGNATASKSSNKSKAAFSSSKGSNRTSEKNADPNCCTCEGKDDKSSRGNVTAFKPLNRSYIPRSTSRKISGKISNKAADSDCKCSLPSNRFIQSNALSKSQVAPATPSKVSNKVSNKSADSSCKCALPSSRFMQRQPSSKSPSVKTGKMRAKVSNNGPCCKCETKGSKSLGHKKLHTGEQSTPSPSKASSKADRSNTKYKSSSNQVLTNKLSSEDKVLSLKKKPSCTCSKSSKSMGKEGGSMGETRGTDSKNSLYFKKSKSTCSCAENGITKDSEKSILLNSVSSYSEKGVGHSDKSFPLESEQPSRSSSKKGDSIKKSEKGVPLSVEVSMCSCSNKDTGDSIGVGGDHHDVMKDEETSCLCLKSSNKSTNKSNSESLKSVGLKGTQDALKDAERSLITKSFDKTTEHKESKKSVPRPKDPKISYSPKIADGKHQEIHPCDECEGANPCDNCFEEERQRKVKQVQVPVCLQRSCEKCRLAEKGCKTCPLMENPSCPLCKLHDAKQSPKSTKPKSKGGGDPSSICDCPTAIKEKLCPCGCGFYTEGEDETCPCGCGQLAELPADAEKEKPVKPSTHKMGERGRSKRSKGCDCEEADGCNCKVCSCVESARRLVDADKKAYDQIPETCPCIKYSEREAQMEHLADQLQEDISSVTKKNEVLQKLVASCRCANDKVQEVFKRECCNCNEPAPIRPTYSGLLSAVEVLQAKCRNKDGMIAVLAEELRGSPNVEEIAKSLASSERSSWDFDQCALYNYIKEPITKLLTETASTKSENVDQVRPIASNPEVVVPAPLDFNVTRIICNDCLLVSWKMPGNTSEVTGYEILANGFIAARVRNASRMEALLTSLDTSSPVFLTLYAVGPGERLSDPITLSYPSCSCYDA